MRKSRPHKKKFKPEPIEKYNKNENILSPELLVIDENNVSLGLISTADAVRIAQERELDLVEVSPKANPPVAKFIDYGKFQYQQEKLAKKQRAKQKKTDIKGIRLSLRIGKHDQDIRKKAALKFLEEGNKVKVEMILRGRERQYTANAKTVFDEFLTGLGNDIKVEQPFSNQGGRLTMLIAPKSVS